MKKEKSKLIFTISFTALVLGLSVYGCYYVFGQVMQKKNDVMEVRKQIFWYEKGIENIKNLEQAINDVADDKSEIAGIFFKDGESLVDFIEELEFLAKKTGVVLKVNSLQPSENKGEKALFQVSLAGTFADIYHYIYLLEHDPFWVSIEKLGLSKTPDKNWSAQISLILLSFNDQE